MQRFWLVKTMTESNVKYEECLLAAGFNVHFLSALKFNYINNSAIKAALNEPENHSGIIFTSSRAVEATYMAYKDLNFSVHTSWLSKKIFGVGESTCGLIKQKLCLDPIGKDSGNAQYLAELITNEIEAFSKPLLFPCGNLKKEDLPKILAQNDIDFRAITCYETSCHPELERNMEDLLDEFGVPDGLVFFSPSGVSYILPILRGFKVDPMKIKFIAFGASTNAALVDAALPVAGVCPTPTPEGLLHVLQGLQ